MLSLHNEFTGIHSNFNVTNNQYNMKYTQVKYMVLDTCCEPCQFIHLNDYDYTSNTVLPLMHAMTILNLHLNLL